MKINFVIILAASAFILNSCDKVDAPYREQNNSGQALGDNSVVINTDTLTLPDDTTADVKKVLAEDYTGHLCGNCPAAGVWLNDTLKAIYGSQLCVISVHTGEFADICPTALDCPNNPPTGSFETDFRTTVGDAWRQRFGITAYPIGMIDRTGYPTSHKKTYTSWAGAIQSEFTLAPEVKLRVLNKYNSSTRLLETAVQSVLLTGYTQHNLKLQVEIVEDSLPDWQQWYGHTPLLVPDYVHHDVLRQSYNGDSGDIIGTQTSVAGNKFVNGYYATLNAAWNDNHCSVVAFIYDADTFKVIQVEQVSVK